MCLSSTSALAPWPSLVGMSRLWQQRIQGTRQVGQETDRGCSHGGCWIRNSGTLPCCLAFLLLRPMKTQSLFRKKYLRPAPTPKPGSPTLLRELMPRVSLSRPLSSLAGAWQAAAESALTFWLRQVLQEWTLWGMCSTGPQSRGVTLQ